MCCQLAKDKKKNKKKDKKKKKDHMYGLAATAAQKFHRILLITRIEHSAVSMGLNLPVQGEWISITLALDSIV